VVRTVKFRSNQAEIDLSNDRGPREMHKATCAECKQECEVPFKPSGDKPVFCKECFAKKQEDQVGKFD
jgi:CxxC-x17-CxxC domain-containing protein